MILVFTQLWALLTHDGFKYNMNITEVLGVFTEQKIKVGKQKAMTSSFNQVYDMLQDDHRKKLPQKVTGQKTSGSSS